MKDEQRNQIISMIVKDAVTTPKTKKTSKFRGCNCRLTIIGLPLSGGDKLIVIIMYMPLSHYSVDNRYNRDGSNSALRVG